MKIKCIFFLSFFLIMGTASFAQDASKEVKPFPFAQYNDPKLSLISLADAPPGYKRISSERFTLFQHWLSNLPLMPPKTPILNWKGKIISKADTLNRIVDMNIDSKYATDADILVLFLMHFFRLQNKLDNFNIILKENLVVNYKNWLRGKYIEEKKRDIYFRNEGLSRIDSDEEFQAYIEFVTRHFDNKSLRKNVEHINSLIFKPSNVLIHFKLDDPDSIGHTAVILDAAVASGKPRKMLVAYGGNPAQSVIIPNAGRTGHGGWFSIDEIREHLKENGMGYLYRWKQ